MGGGCSSDYNMEDLKLLRRTLRAARRDIQSAQRALAQQKVITSIIDLEVYQNARHIAAYLAMDGELDLSGLLTQAWADGKNIYLPVLTGAAQPLLFAPYTAKTPMKIGSYKIPEPAVPRQQMVTGDVLDLVLTPLVGFDDKGYRLGMGGGFYDRSFAFRQQPEHSKPYLLGIAFEQQQAPLPHRSWDVRLDAVVTQNGVYRW